MLLRFVVYTLSRSMSNCSMSYIITEANESHLKYAEHICDLIFQSACQRGTGIAKRSPEYIVQKMRSGKAIVALDGNRIIGFSYIECWGHGDYVATSGLIVDPDYRHQGLAEQIKKRTFALARKKFPCAKIFSITTSLPVMKLNTRLGYEPVTFSELTDDEEFWSGCKGCVNFDILKRNNNTRCLCTGMLYDPKKRIGTRKANPYIMYIFNRLKKLFR